MKDERITWGLAICSILIQWYFMYVSDDFEMALPFSSGLLSADTTGGNMTQVMFVIIPVPFLLWLFSGRIETLTKGYGKMLIIRNYNRKKILLKEVGKMTLTVILLQCFSWTVFQAFANVDWKPLTMAQQAKSMTLYILVLVGTVLLQYCLEFLMNQIYANTITLVYYIISLFCYGAVQDTGTQAILRGMFFPNLGFAMRNGAIETGTDNLFFSSVVEILLICTLFVFISLKIVSKKDIM